MKNLLVLILLLVTGCQSFPANQAIKPEDRQFSERLPNLNVIFENNSSINSYALEASKYSNTASQEILSTNTPLATLFEREMNKNIMNEYGEPKGTITLKPIIHTTEFTGNVYMLPSVLTLYIANAFGMPFNTVDGFCELEAKILDKDGNLIKKYASEGQVTEKIALYHGYDYAEGLEAAKFNSYKIALSKILEDINNDTNYLNEKLNK